MTSKLVGVFVALLLATLPAHLLSREQHQQQQHAGDVTNEADRTCRARVATLRFNNSLRPHIKTTWEPLITCRSFSNHTCCSRSDSEEIKRLNLMGASAGHSDRCRSFTKLFNCMPCDGDVGTGLKTAACAGFCNDWFDACRDEFYKTSQDGSIIRPCFGDYLICSPLHKIVRDGAGFCSTMGVEVSDDPAHCYEGTPSGKLGVPEPRPPNDDVDIAGFRFRKGDGAVSEFVRSLKQAWETKTPLELGIAGVCVATALALTVTVSVRFAKAGRHTGYPSGVNEADSSDSSSDDEQD